MQSHRIFIKFFVISIASSYISPTVSICNEIIDSSSEKFQPLFLQNKTNDKFTFILPQNGIISLKEADSMVVVCPNKGNFLVNSNANLSVAICTNGKLKLANKLHNINDLQCNKSIRGEIKPTNKKCGNDEGYLTNIGYYVGRIEFLTLIEICYDSDKGITLYTDHIVYGESISNASRSNLRPSFSMRGSNPDISLFNAYKRTNQKSIFNNVPEIADLTKIDNLWLAKGHLAPDADFPLASWQHSTYFHINAVPQWQTINTGKWKSVEYTIRKKAAELKENIRVISGASGILTYSNHRIYLLNNKVPVPEFLYKIVYRPRTKEGIVIAVVNDPFNKINNTGPCTDSCVDYGWVRKQKKVERLNINCCEYKDLRNYEKGIVTLDVQKVLKGPNKL